MVLEVVLAFLLLLQSSHALLVYLASFIHLNVFSISF